MSEKSETYYLVNKDILPEAIKKTIRVKEILKMGEAKTINEAVERMDLSRSAFYKYKDYVFPFYETSTGKIVSIYVTVSNEPGILSKILTLIAEAKASVLTINQNIPLQGVASISISFETKHMLEPLQVLIENIEHQEGVLTVDILGQA